MSAFGDPRDNDDDDGELPERIIFVREPAARPGDIDLDEVDLRAEPADLHADQAWLDTLAAADGDDAGGADEGPPTQTYRWEWDDDGQEVGAGPVATPGADVDEPTQAFRWDPDDDDDEADELPPIAVATPFPEPEPEPTPPRRDETGPDTLRPLVPEPVIADRTTAVAAPSRTRRTVSRLRALIGLFVVVLLAGVGLAAAIGGAVLLVVFVLSRAFGSG